MESQVKAYLGYIGRSGSSKRSRYYLETAQDSSLPGALDLVEYNRSGRFVEAGRRYFTAEDALVQLHRLPGFVETSPISMKRKRSIAVGDIHGELNAFRNILNAAGLINGEDRWAGSDTVLIQVGDAIDRGPHSLETVDLLRRLQKEAPAAGGKVVRLCGNHELMLLQGFFHYANFKNPEALAAELKEEIAKGDVCASFTDGERLFTHAGLKSAVRDRIMEELKNENPEITEMEIGPLPLCDYMNGIFRKSVQSNSYESHAMFWAAPERGGDDPAGGIFWCDFSSMKTEEEAGTCPQVFGHTPTRKNMLGTAHGLRLINVDTGMCWIYGGQRAYLEITAGSDIVQHSKDSASLKWNKTLLAGGATASMEWDPGRRRARRQDLGL